MLCLLLGCVGQTRPKPDWTTAPGADVPALSTFALSEPPEGAPRAILDTQIRNAVRTALVEKGYVESADAPDFVVSYATDSYETSGRPNPVSIGIGVGSWGGNVGGSVGTSVGVGGDDEPRLHNRLTIRSVDPEANRELWIGTTTTFDQPADADVIDRVVAGVMKGFPAKRD